MKGVDIMKITFEISIEELEKLFGEVEEETEEKPKSGKFKWEPTEFMAWYNEECTAWSKDPQYNKMYLVYQQNYFNDVLRTRGHLYLNEVYDALGIPRTKAGQMIGWFFEDKNSYVDFGLNDPRNAEFINGKTTNALLVFNVDGVIIDKI